MTAPSLRRRSVTAESQLPEQVHPLLRRILAGRGILHPDQLRHELSALPDPYLLKDMDKAVERLVLALSQQQKIVIVGDFDADGATSSALLLLALRAMGFQQVGFVVPDRFRYGYGLSPAIVDELQQQKPDLLITVDNGISSVEGVTLANRYGMDVVITDHHLPGAELPQASAIVNPNQRGCPFPGKGLSGVGVAFFLLLALRKRLRDSGYFSENGIAEPNLANYLDLVALGTVADVVPMDRCNRILVHQGIQRIRRGLARPGIRHLLQVGGRDCRTVSTSDIGFTVAPRLNAAGRLDDMTQGIMLLVTDSEELAADLAQALDQFNRDRRAIEEGMLQEAAGIVDGLTSGVDVVPHGFCLYHPGWHQGVVGLVASRLKEKYHRPVIAFADAGANGEIKGSGRSIEGIHLRDLLDGIAAKNPGMVSRFGGHAMAAGLSLDAAQLEEFRKAFLHALEEIGRRDRALFDSVLESDGEIAPSDLNLYVAQLIRDVLPWGKDLPEPLFDGEFRVLKQRVVGEKHLKLQVALHEKDLLGVEAMIFHFEQKGVSAHPLQRAHLAYRLGINTFRGTPSLQLLVERVIL